MVKRGRTVLVDNPQKDRSFYGADDTDPSPKARITNLVLENLPTSSKALSRSGKHMLDGPAKFGVHFIRELAARIGVSRNSPVRLSGSLGFESFDDLALAGSSDLLFAVTAYPGAWHTGTAP